jgi:hypothetical protein
MTLSYISRALEFKYIEVETSFGYGFPSHFPLVRCAMPVQPFTLFSPPLNQDTQ